MNEYWLFIGCVAVFVLWPRPVLSALVVVYAIGVIWSGARVSWRERRPVRALWDTVSLVAWFGSLAWAILYFLWS